MSNPRNNTSKRIVRTLSRTVDNAVLLTLLVCLIFAVYALWDTHKMLDAADAHQFEEYKPTTENRLSFDQLRAMNNDVIAWLTIYDTTIDYPVLRSPNTNNDYLSKNAKGEWEGSGSLFIDHNNSADFSDFNTIIFGHHMAGPAMFGQLDEFLDKSFFEKHEYANLYFSDGGLELVQKNTTTGLTYDFTNYNGRNHGIQFFAMCQVDAHDVELYSVPSRTQEAQQKSLDIIADRAILVRNLSTGEIRQLGKAGAASPTKTASVDSSFFGVTTNDRIVLMSTCSADITNGRFVLVGKLLDNEVPNPFPEEEDTIRNAQLDIFSMLDNILKLPLWQWILILIALILLTWLLYKTERKRVQRKKEKKLQKEQSKD